LSFLKRFTFGYMVMILSLLVVRDIGDVYQMQAGAEVNYLIYLAIAWVVICLVGYRGPEASIFTLSVLISGLVTLVISDQIRFEGTLRESILISFHIFGVFIPAMLMTLDYRQFRFLDEMHTKSSPPSKLKRKPK